MTRSDVLMIRADAGVAIGSGHVMRCLALAQGWQDIGGRAVVAYACMPSALEKRLRDEQVELVKLEVEPGSVEDSEKTAMLAAQQGTSWVVVDGYRFGAGFQRTLKAANLKVLFIDDYGHSAHYSADLVLNQEGFDGVRIYSHRDPETRLLLGPRYAMLRREFTAQRGWRRKIAPTARRVLVTLGGTDPANLTSIVMEGLRRIDADDVEIMVVVGGGNPHLQDIRRVAESFPIPVEIQQSVSNMAEVMTWADLAISAAGTTCWEMFMLGLPAIIIPAADNQVQASFRFDEIGAAKEIKNTGPELAVELGKAISELLRSQEARARMSATGMQLVDGLGVARILHELGYEVRLNLSPTNVSRVKLTE